MNQTRSGPIFFRKRAQTLKVNLGNADLASVQQKNIFVKNFLWLNHLPWLILHLPIRKIFFRGIFLIPKIDSGHNQFSQKIDTEGKNGFNSIAEERAASFE